MFKLLFSNIKIVRMYFQFVKISSLRIQKFLLYSRPRYVFDIINYNSTAYFVTFRSRYYIVLRCKGSFYYYRLSAFSYSCVASSSFGFDLNKLTIKQMIITLFRYVIK